VWVGAAVGATLRSAAGRRIAAATTRRSAAASSGSVPFCPQVSELNGQSGAGVAARGTSGACLRSGCEKGKGERLETLITAENENNIE